MRSYRLAFRLFVAGWVSLTSALAVTLPSRNQGEKLFEVTMDPIFPPKLQFEGRMEGSASFLIVIDREGRLQDYLLLEATHDLFGKAVSDVIPRWKFFPVTLDGKMANVVRRININFQTSGSVISLLPQQALEGMFNGVGDLARKKEAYRIASLRDLDRLPEPVIIVEPQLFKDEARNVDGRTILFHFYIDETGRVRIPLADESTEPPVDEWVLDSIHRALVQWQFTPPTIDGNPVVTRATQPFRIFKNGHGAVAKN